ACGPGRAPPWCAPSPRATRPPAAARRRCPRTASRRAGRACAASPRWPGIRRSRRRRRRSRRDPNATRRMAPAGASFLDSRAMTAPLLLLAAFAAGPHARDALEHAQDPDAAWVTAAPVPVRTAASAPAVTRRVYGYLPYWESIDLANYRWDLITDVIAFSV